MTESERASTATDESPVRVAQDPTQSLREELLREGVQKRLTKLDPTAKKKKPIRWQQVVGVLVLILVLGLVAWGILGWLGVISSGHLGFARTDQDSSVLLISADDNFALVLVHREDRGEVRLINTTTGAVLDVSQGDTHASHAALSPQKDTVAYVSTDGEGSSLRLVEASGEVKRVFNSNSLNSEAEKVVGTSARICEWSDLDWSPDFSRLAFFVCSDEASALFVVATEEKATPVLVAGTRMPSVESRDATWLEVNSIALTFGDKSIDSVIIIDLKNNQSERLFGPLKQEGP